MPLTQYRPTTVFVYRHPILNHRTSYDPSLSEILLQLMLQDTKVLTSGEGRTCTLLDVITRKREIYKRVS